MFHLAGYFVAAGVADANVDMAARPDSVFSIRNNHFIFSEQYNLIAAAHLAASATDARLNVPSLNAISRHHIWPVNRSATPPSFPRIQDLRSNPIPIPVNEELAVEESNNLGAATEDTTAFLWLAPPSWNRNLPPSSKANPRLVLRATAAVARTADTWSGLGAITFEQTPRGGWYCVNGVYCQDVNCRAFRVFFPRNTLINGRILRPGALCSAALGDLEYPYFKDGLGEWGRFHTFEPPQIEVYGDAAGASTQILMLDVTYLGDTPSY